MKRVLIVLFCILLTLSLNAQDSFKHPLYLSGGMNFGNYVGLNLSLNYFLTEEYTIEIGYTGLVRQARSKPDDYTSGLVGLFTLGLSELHFDQMENFQLLAGKIVRSNQTGTVRWNISGGLAYTIISEPTNWVKINDNSWGPNYSFDTNKSNSVSVILNPKVEFPITNLFGFTVSPKLITNFKRFYIGVDLDFMLGLLK